MPTFEASKLKSSSTSLIQPSSSQPHTLIEEMKEDQGLGYSSYDDESNSYNSEDD